MQIDQEHPRTHLFLVRLWVEPLAENLGEVRMQVTHVLSGETYYFRAWPDVVAFLLAKLLGAKAGSRPDADEPS